MVDGLVVEGDGHVKIAGYSFGQMTLTVGSNNLNTKFDGLLEELSYEKGAEGSIKKIGSGRLILTDANSYHGSTTVEAGRVPDAISLTRVASSGTTWVAEAQRIRGSALSRW